MKDREEKIAEIDTATQRWWYITLLLIAVIGGLGILTIQRANPTNVLSAGKIVLITLIILFAMTYGDNWIRAYQWKELFLEEFPEIDPIEMEKTAYVFECSFSVIASAVVFSYDTWDFARHTFRDEEFRDHSKRLKAKQQYLAFAGKNKL